MSSISSSTLKNFLNNAPQIGASASCLLAMYGSDNKGYANSDVA